MTDDELNDLLTIALGNWGHRMTPKAIQAMGRAWYRYLHDLDHDKVLEALDWLVIKGHWSMPGAGELRKLAMGAPRASDSRRYAAWSDMQARIQEAGNAGGWAARTEVSETVDLILRRIGESWKQMSTNGDRDKFFAVYDEVVAEQEWDQYKPAEE